MKFIPVNQPLLNGNERLYLNECLDSGWISSEGPFVDEFEKEFAKRHGRKHGIAVSNGTAALQCAIDSLDLKPGDEVIVPTFTIISCVTAIIQAKAIPVLVDCDANTFNSTPEQILSAITSKTKAIMLVHIYGLPVDADPIIEIAKKKDIFIVEDAAEVIGLEYKNRNCGGLGDVSTFSFYANKHITTGEGGMILTDDDKIAKNCRSSRNLCFQKDIRFVHERIGWNFRMTNLQAAIGLAQLEQLDDFVKLKRKLGKKYTELLNSCSNLQLPIPETVFAQNVYWVYGVVLSDDFKYNASKIITKLRNKNIGSRPFFYPMHLQPVFRKMGFFKNEVHPNSERLSKQGFYLPCGLGTKESDVSRVAKVLCQTLN